MFASKYEFYSLISMQVAVQKQSNVRQIAIDIVRSVHVYYTNYICHN